MPVTRAQGAELLLFPLQHAQTPYAEEPALRPYTEPKETALELTPLEDADAIQLAISEVVLALAANRIDARRARILIYGLQVASQNHRHRAVMEAKENIAETTVRETHEHERHPHRPSQRNP